MWASYNSCNNKVIEVGEARLTPSTPIPDTEADYLLVVVITGSVYLV